MTGARGTLKGLPRRKGVKDAIASFMNEQIVWLRRWLEMRIPRLSGGQGLEGKLIVIFKRVF